MASWCCKLYIWDSSKKPSAGGQWKWADDILIWSYGDVCYRNQSVRLGGEGKMIEEYNRQLSFGQRRRNWEKLRKLWAMKLAGCLIVPSGKQSLALLLEIVVMEYGGCGRCEKPPVRLNWGSVTYHSVTLGKLLNLGVPQSSHLQMELMTVHSSLGCLGGLNKS